MQLESAFKAIDRDGSGAIDRAEMKQVSALWSELTDPPKCAHFTTLRCVSGSGEIYSEASSRGLREPVSVFHTFVLCSEQTKQFNAAE